MALLIPPDVLEQLAGLPKVDRKRVLEALEAVAADPGFRWPFVTEMVGLAGVWRLRKGDWRAVYRLVEAPVPPAPTPGLPAEAARRADAEPNAAAQRGEAESARPPTDAAVGPPDGVPGDGPRAGHPDVVPRETPDVVVIWVGHRREAYR